MRVRFWRALKSVAKIYGMPQLAVILALVGVVISMFFFGLIFGLAGAVPGYFLGNYLAYCFHDGKAQRFIHWYFPSKSKRHLPDSCNKFFF